MVGGVAIEVRLAYRFAAPTDVLLQIEVADCDGQKVVAGRLELGGLLATRVTAEGGVGQRSWVHVVGDLVCVYRAEVEILRTVPSLERLGAVAMHDLPGDVVGYLLPSRFCDTWAFEAFAASEFAGLMGGARVLAIVEWVAGAVAYVPGASTGGTTAADTFVQRQGVCRDYAHLVIALARASGIPARFASVYAPNVVPQDFHAVAEVYLEGGWVSVDATGMSCPGEMARIGVGQDAAGAAFLTSFGWAEFLAQEVRVSRLNGALWGG